MQTFILYIVAMAQVFHKSHASTDCFGGVPSQPIVKGNAAQSGFERLRGSEAIEALSEHDQQNTDRTQIGANLRTKSSQSSGDLFSLQPPRIYFIIAETS